MNSERFTVRKARPKVEKDKAWIVLDENGRMVGGLGRMTEAEARKQAKQLNGEER